MYIFIYKYVLVIFCQSFVSRKPLITSINTALKISWYLMKLSKIDEWAERKENIQKDIGIFVIILKLIKWNIF